MQKDSIHLQLKVATYKSKHPQYQTLISNLPLLEEEEVLVKTIRTGDVGKLWNYRYYFFIHNGQLIFKEIALIYNREHSVYPRPEVKGIFCLATLEDINLGKPNTYYIEAKQFNTIRLVGYDKWYRLLMKCRQILGMDKPIKFKTKVPYKKYFRQKKWRLAKLIFYVVIYHEHKRYNIPPKILAEYFNLSKRQIDHLIAEMFYMHCQMKNCPLLPLMQQ